MPSTTIVPPSLPYLLNRIDFWRNRQSASTCTDYQTTCELIIVELQLVADYAKSH